MSESPRFAYVLRLADTALVLGHRLSQWSARAPTLEEDIALSNLALDLIGQSRLFYAHAGLIEGKGRDEDGLAYLRDETDYRNLLIAEQPNGDFAATMARQLFFAGYAEPYYAALTRSKDETLAAIGAKAAKEMAYHWRHSAEWIIRLGDGTAESHARAQAGIDDLAIYVDEMFTPDEAERAMIAAGIAPDPALLRASFDAEIGAVLAEATLKTPRYANGQGGGRAARHTEALGTMLAEMQSLHRAHAGAVW